MTWRVVFRDAQNRTYSAAAEKHGDTWMMLTSDGWQPIAATFDDDFGGRLSFVEYRDEPDSRLHVEGQGFRALQEAVAKERLRNEEERASARREALNAMNEPDARKIQQARAINNQFAQRLNPKRPEPIQPPVDQVEVVGIAETLLHKKAEKAGRE